MNFFSSDISYILNRIKKEMEIIDMKKIRNDVTYSIKALMYLYENKQSKNITALEISESEDIPINFLYTILRKLKDYDYIEITPGLRGGYKLGKSINKATLLDLISIITGNFIIKNCCIKDKQCKRYGKCPINQELVRIEILLKKELSKNKIIDLFKQNYSKK